MKIRKETSMNILKMGGAVLVGFVLGAFVYRPVTVKASGSGVIYMKRMTEGQNPDPMVANRDIVGFSCTSGAMGTECFLAVR
jgi:hypothetical protein